MTTRKRNIMIASAAAAAIAVAATVTVVTLTPKNDDMVDVGNALAMLNVSEQDAPDTPGAPDSRNPAVTVSGGADNDTPVVILETEDAAADGEKDTLPESTDAPSNDKGDNGDKGDKNDNGDKDSKDDKGNAEKEDIPDSTAAPSAAPSAKPESKPKSEPKPAPADSDTPASSKPKSDKPKADKPAVTVVTNPQAVTAPPSTVRDDLPKVEPEPKYTTSPEDKAAQTEPTVVDKLDNNGFPANPVSGQEYVDGNGNRWVYMEFIGWVEANGPGVTLQEFPDNYDGGVFGGEQILG